MATLRRTAGLAATVWLTACVQAPVVPAPELGLPARYASACAVAARPAAPAAMDAWWQGFSDAGLAQAVERALQDSPVLAQAAARADQARAGAQGAGARRLPQAELRAGTADVRQSLLDPVPRLGQAVPGFERNFVQNQIGVGAAWDLDPAGGERAREAAAQADAHAAASQWAATRIAVAAETAQSYLTLRTLQARLDLAREQETVQQRLASLVGQRADRGLSARRDVDHAEAALEGVRATIPPLRAAIDAEVARLQVLQGRAPGSQAPELLTPAALPSAPGIAQAQGPAALMRRRPDLVAAEQRLVAASARIAAATAGYYPSLSLSALLGWSSSVSGRLLGGDALTGDAALALRWRLFDFGRVDAEVAGARGREAEALAAYRAAVWTAAAEVESALSAVLQEDERARTLDRQWARLKSARERTQLAYTQGAASLIEVLDLDRQMLAAADQRLQARSAVARATVAAFRALGGGWQAPAPEAPAAGCDTAALSGTASRMEETPR